MSMIIKIDTGFVGGIHEEYTNLSKEEWEALSEDERADWIHEAIMDNIEAYAVDEDDEE